MSISTQVARNALMVSYLATGANTVNPPITRLIRTALYGNRAIRNSELIQIRLFVPRYIETIAALYGNRAIRNLELIQIRLFVPRYIETMLSEFQK